jgi:hypothetical protein
MSGPDFLTWLHDIGTAGAVIFVMLTFLKYIKSRDDAMEKTLEEVTLAVTTLTNLLKGKD